MPNESEIGIQLRIIKNFFKRKLDAYVIYPKQRWIFYFGLLLILITRILSTQGFYAIAYLLGFYTVQKLILYVTPLDLPTIQEEEENETEIYDIPEVIRNTNDSSKPVIRKLSEFHLWLNNKEESELFHILECHLHLFSAAGYTRILAFVTYLFPIYIAFTCIETVQAHEKI